MYDSRIGRWFKPDAFEARLPMMSPYHFGLDNPSRYSDHEGDFVIDEATAKAYPQLKPVLAALVAELQKPENEKKADELVRLGQFKDRQAFLDVLTDGKGPKLSVQNIINVDIKVTKLPDREVQVQSPLGGTITQTQEGGTVTEYLPSLTDIAKSLGIFPETGNPAAVTITKQEQKEIIETTRGGKVIKTEGKVIQPFSQEVILDDNTANILNNTKGSLNKDGTINMKKAGDALTYFLKLFFTKQVMLEMNIPKHRVPLHQGRK